MSDLTDSKHIFVSYAHADAPLAIKAATAMARVGIPFFIDKIGLSPGDSLRGRLGDALDQAQAVVALITSHSLQSEWVRKELTLLSDRGGRIVPVRCDDSKWPAVLGLTFGDALYVDGRDPVALAGRIPKVFHECLSRNPAENAERFFKLCSRPRTPYARFFAGTIQTALEEIAFGRVAIVVPTDTYVNLSGKVTSSLLDFLAIDRDRLERRRHSISSREACDLGTMHFRDIPVHLLASTVFNADHRLCAEDQWRAAAAVLTRAQELGCDTLLVPPMGTGAYGWPRGAALQHWLYGAIRWAANNPLATEDSTWAVMCQPGAGGQRMFSEYLSRVDSATLQRLENRQLAFVVDYAGTARPTGPVRHDMMLGSIVGQAWPELRTRRDIVATHPALSADRRGNELRYHLGTPLNKTVFADGDMMRILDKGTPS